MSKPHILRAPATAFEWLRRPELESDKAVTVWEEPNGTLRAVRGTKPPMLTKANFQWSDMRPSKKPIEPA